MVLSRDGDFAGAKILDRVVSSAVTELELVGGAAEAVSQDLVSQADSKHGDLPDELFDLVVDIGEGGGISGPVREKDPIGLFRENFAGRGAGIYDLDFEA